MLPGAVCCASSAHRGTGRLGKTAMQGQGGICDMNTEPLAPRRCPPDQAATCAYYVVGISGRGGGGLPRLVRPTEGPRPLAAREERPGMRWARSARRCFQAWAAALLPAPRHWAGAAPAGCGGNSRLTRARRGGACASRRRRTRWWCGSSRARRIFRLKLSGTRLVLFQHLGLPQINAGRHGFVTGGVLLEQRRIGRIPIWFAGTARGVLAGE